MLIFIISVILTAIVSLCFFKKDFWENRYLILLIAATISFVAILTTNYAIRSNLPKKTQVIWRKNMNTLYLKDTLYYKKSSISISNLDSAGKKTNTKTIIKIDSLIKRDSIFSFVRNWDYNSYSSNTFFYNKKDSINLIPLHYVIYTVDNDTIFGYFDNEYDQIHYQLNKIYIAASESDTLAYIQKKKIFYDTDSNIWLTGILFPRISSILIFYLPPKEYKTIPKEFLRKIPY